MVGDEASPFYSEDSTMSVIKRDRMLDHAYAQCDLEAVKALVGIKRRHDVVAAMRPKLARKTWAQWLNEDL